MSDSRRMSLTPDLVATMAAASGRPVEPDDLDEVTSLITALFDLESLLDRFDVSDITPEFKWDARWEIAE